MKAAKTGVRCIVSVALVCIMSNFSYALDYKLGPGDKIRLMVYEWRPSRGESYSWTALNAEFEVSPAGVLSLPLVGTIKAESRSAEQLSASISEELKKRMGLLESPSASVEIVKFRPFYIVGDVNSPGAYTYRPELTAMKAVSLAGGVYRSSANSVAALERESTVSRGDIRVMEAEKVNLSAKRVRLKAEATDQTKIDFSSVFPQVAPNSPLGEAIRDEQTIFDSRMSAMRFKVESLTRTKDIIDKELATLAAKDANLGTQLTLAQNERAGVKALAEKGLAITNRQFSVEQAVAQLESARLDTVVARVKAEQDRAKIDRDIAELRDQRRAEILLELRQLDSKMQELDEKIATSRSLVAHAESLGSSAGRTGDERDQVSLEIYVTRKNGEQSQVIRADSNFGIEPDDLIEIRRRVDPAAKPKDGQIGRGAVRPNAIPSSYTQR